jgi:hypothetical protein
MSRQLKSVLQLLSTATWTRTVPEKVAVHVIGEVPKTSTLLDKSVSVNQSEAIEDENE